MPEQNGQELEQEVFDRWLHMYRRGKLTRREFGRVLAALSVTGSGLGALLSGCGPSTPAPAATTKPAAPGQTQPTSAPQAAKQAGKDTLVTAIESDLPNMDPHMQNIRVGLIFHYHLFDNLGVRDLSNMSIAPHLATSWKPVEPTVWEMDLRQDVQFHNGEPFNAEAVKFNWERVLNPDQKSLQRGNHEAIAAVDVVSPYKVRVRTKRPYPIFVERLQNFQIVPPKYVKEKGDAWVAEHPVGSGPYKFVEWKRDQFVSLERNDSYWGAKPAIKNLVFRTIPEKATQIGELLGGKLDVMRGLPIDQMQTVSNSSVASATTQRILRVGFIGLDARGRTGPNPFQDKRVRNAANHALNIDAYIKSLQPGGERTPAMVNPMHFGFDASVKPHEYDPEKAKALLTEAGFANGFDARFLTQAQLLMPNQAMVEQAMQRDLAKVGIRVDISVVGANTYEELCSTGKGGPMYHSSWGSFSVFDTDGIYWDRLHSSANYSYWDNKEFDKLIEDGRGNMDPEFRKKVYAQAQKIVREEAPMIFLWGYHQVWGVSKAISWKPDPDEIERYFTAKPA